MKYGLLYYKDTDNIGDDIQSYAASKFMEKIDYMIDREQLELFVPNNKEYVATIMNGWYTHSKLTFEFSPYIYPHLISMHFDTQDYAQYIKIGARYLNENNIKYLKKYGPVGVRDYHTEEIMDNLEVDNYFSGCLTLTLDKFDNQEKGNYIVAVGLNDKEIKKIKEESKREVVVIEQDIPKGSLSNKSWQERSNQVEQILKTYQNAHMVITKKLHCALPSLALETPVLLLYDHSTKERISTYLEYLNNLPRENFLNSKIDYDNPKKNSTKYLKLRKELKESCKEFIKKSKNIKLPDNLPKPSFYKEYVTKSRISRYYLIDLLDEQVKNYIKEKNKK